MFAFLALSVTFLSLGGIDIPNKAKTIVFISVLTISLAVMTTTRVYRACHKPDKKEKNTDIIDYASHEIGARRHGQDGQSTMLVTAEI